MTVVRPASVRTLAVGHGAGRGATLRYTVILANANKKNKTMAATAFDQAGLVVQLPAGTTFAKGSVSPRPRIPGTKPDKALATAVYDAEAHTVTWPDVPLAGGRKRKYTVVAKVLPTAVSPLVFAAGCPSCGTLTTESTVTVRGGVWLCVHADGMAPRLPTKLRRLTCPQKKTGERQVSVHQGSNPRRAAPPRGARGF